jgi:peptidoglycan-associated lipoprotein
MIPVQAGRGGWVARRDSFIRVGAMVLVVAVFALGGCSSKKPEPGLGTRPGGGGLGEEGIGGKSSLEQFQKGTLGAENASGPLMDIHFDYNEFTIRPEDSQILRSNAAWLTKNPGSRVQVEGHCDERGSEEYNIALGAKRAQATKDYLSTMGVSADRVSTISYGKELPVCTDHTESCWARNRRARFVVSQ